jgi:hypothetical protein
MKQVVLLLFFSYSLFGQTITKTLVIDSVFGNVTNLGVYIYDPGNWKSELGDVDNYTPKVVKNKQPNFVMTINTTSIKESLRITIDDSGGYFELKNIYTYKFDTIHINHFTVYKNCLTDTVLTRISRYKVIENDTGRHSYKFLGGNKSFKVIHKCSMTVPKTISFNLNGVAQTLPIVLKLSPNSVFSYFHGMNNRNEKKRMQNKSYKYFAGEQEERKYMMICEFDLINLH